MKHDAIVTVHIKLVLQVCNSFAICNLSHVRVILYEMILAVHLVNIMIEKNIISLELHTHGPSANVFWYDRSTSHNKLLH